MLLHFAACVLVAFQGGKAAPAKTDAHAAAEDARARRAFAALAPDVQRELFEWLELELAQAGSFRSSLVEFVRKNAGQKMRTASIAAPAAYFDPSEHTPESVIERHPLAADSPSVKRVVESFFKKVAKRPLRVAWRYDWGSGELGRTADEAAPERLFENALHGFAPGIDLCEAFVESCLDDGSLRTSALAFGHAYTDRDGGVYPGVTLYDAYASGEAIEMPDVDVLGIVHVVLGDRTTWRAPVPSSKHAALYAKVGALFRDLQHHRGLRCAIARAFASGNPPMDGVYGGVLDNFHALWEDCRSTPAELAQRLPKPDDWQKFLGDWTERCMKDGELYQAGILRGRTLDAEADDVRKTLLVGLETFGSFERAGGRAR